MDENPICHGRYAAKRLAAEDDESLIKFRNFGKFRDIKWKILKQDWLDEKPGGGWLGFESLIELALEPRVMTSRLSRLNANLLPPF